MRNMENGDNSAMGLENVIKIKSCHLHLKYICDPNIMTLAEAVLEIFVHKLPLD